MAFLHGLNGVFSLIIMVLVGFFLSRRHWFDAATVKLLPKFITIVCLPPMLGATIYKSFLMEDVAHFAKAIGAPLAIITILFVCALLLAKVLRVSKRHFGLFCASISNSNTIFIGIPVNMALFGPDAVGYVLFYYFSSTLFFWTVGNFFISRDESEQGGEKVKKRGISWKQIISPPIMGFLCGLALLLIGVKLPEFILNPATAIGQMAMPLALIFIGITLDEIGLSKVSISRDMALALAGRLLGGPLVALLVVPWFGLPKLMADVYITQSALPVLMQISILSAYYNTDPKFGTLAVALSTVLCVITIPCLMILL